MQINEFIQENYSEYINDIESWVDSNYNKSFRSCFDAVRRIHTSMQSQVRAISDTELEWVLSELPMMLFSISESLNKLRLESEVIKLRKKTIKSELDKQATQLAKDGEIAKSDTKSWVDTELADHDVLLAAYNSLITRVESEISFSKELIMGCKKIWDSRRRAEGSNPVSEVVLPKDTSNFNSNTYRDRERYHEPYIR